MPKVIVTKSHKAEAKGSGEWCALMEWKDGEMKIKEFNTKTKNKETPKRTSK